MLSGILAVTTDSGLKHFDIGFQPSAIPLATPAQDYGFAVIVLFAMLGGVVLNLMPCVLPVLSLKALALVKKAGSEAAHVKKLGLAYTLGILISFGLFAGLLIVLQQAGNAVGWGFQMQSPAFVAFLVYLLFLVGLNLSGFFHLPTLLGNAGQGVANEDSTRGSFLTGILAAAVATPCTAPFMASAVGAALTYPVWQAMLVFEALGFGLALPFLLISFFPRLLKFLPKPGAWMNRLKHILAIPMYASVAWLLWVLMQQTSQNGLAVVLMGMTAIFLAVLIKKRHLLIFAFIAAALSLPAMGLLQDDRMPIPASHTQHDVEIVPYSPAKLEALRAAGKPVFVDATAAWCITCQVNARVAIHTDQTMQAFKTQGVTLMVADWTRQNPEISAWLKSFGYQGVPLYVFYPADNQKPKILPQLLTEDIIIKTIQP
jgi:thiol:disulfide interchange protein